MLFKDLNDGDKFTVEGLSGSFIRVNESSLYNAVAEYRDSTSFKFNSNDEVKILSEIITEEVE